jgi:hypothetical protein
MNRCMPIIFSAIFLLTAFFPCQVLAVSITETKAAIGKDCTASGDYSTAMGYDATASDDYSTAMGVHTTASGIASTAMGVYTTASGYASTAMGYETIASGLFSWAGGEYMQLTTSAHRTFVWGHSDSAQSISIARAFLIFPAGMAGKVGIGTKSPQNLLDLGESQGKKLAVFQKTTGADFYGFGISSATLEIYAGAGASDSPAMVVKKTTGRVGIGTTSPGYKLHVNGAAAGTSWTNLSSKEFKEDIRKVDEMVHPMMLTKLMDMNLTTYKYKDEYGGKGDVKLGFIAEDMPQEVLSRDGKGVDIYELITLTIGAMKAQQKEIRNQRRENDALKARLAEVMRRLEALEK